MHTCIEIQKTVPLQPKTNQFLTKCWQDVAQMLLNAAKATVAQCHRPLQFFLFVVFHFLSLGSIMCLFRVYVSKNGYWQNGKCSSDRGRFVKRFTRHQETTGIARWALGFFHSQQAISGTAQGSLKIDNPGRAQIFGKQQVTWPSPQRLSSSLGRRGSSRRFLVHGIVFSIFFSGRMLKVPAF